MENNGYDGWLSPEDLYDPNPKDQKGEFRGEHQVAFNRITAEQREVWRGVRHICIGFRRENGKMIAEIFDGDEHFTDLVDRCELNEKYEVIMMSQGPPPLDI